MREMEEGKEKDEEEEKEEEEEGGEKESTLVEVSVDDYHFEWEDTLIKQV